MTPFFRASLINTINTQYELVEYTYVYVFLYRRNLCNYKI